MNVILHTMKTPGPIAASNVKYCLRSIHYIQISNQVVSENIKLFIEKRNIYEPKPVNIFRDAPIESFLLLIK